MKNQILLIVIALLLSIQAFSQCSGLSGGGGGLENDGFNSGVISDSEGNIYFCGSYQDRAYFGINILTTDRNINEGYFINKYDNLGNLIWSKSLGNMTAYLDFKPITLIGNNIYITLGVSYFQEGADTINSAQIVLWKLDTTGTLIWRKNYLCGGPSYSSSIISDGANGVLITGLFNTSLSLNGIDLYSANSKAWIAHISENGFTQWAKQATPTVVTSFTIKLSLDFFDFLQRSFPPLH